MTAQSMSALMLTSKPKGLEIVELPVPEPGANEVLIRVGATGVCGSDMGAWFDKPSFAHVQPNSVMGHETAGTIAAVGSGVKKLKEGDAVCIIALQGCGECDVCSSGYENLCMKRQVIGHHRNSDGSPRHGGMADYVLVNERHALPLPSGMDLKVGALVEPTSVLANAILNHGYLRSLTSSAQKIEPVGKGTKVIVSGCGPIGAIAALALKKLGADVTITGMPQDQEHRLRPLNKLGLKTLETSAEKPLLGQVGKEFEIFFECSGSPAALQSAHEVTKRAGTVVVVATYPKGLEEPSTLRVRDDLWYHYVFASGAKDYQPALQWLKEGLIPYDLFVREYPLSLGASAFEDAAKGVVLKPMLLPH